MAERPRFADVSVGDALPPLTVRLQRGDLVAYAGASGDLNPIHWNERFAREVGLPDVIAHGMLTMGEAVRMVTAWVGDPGALVSYGVRMTNPVVVPDDGVGATVEVTGTVTELLDDGCVRIALSARCADRAVLGRATAVVRLA